MPKIGIVLSGAASKGAYELGCLRAIEEYFGMKNIKCVSSASIGALISQVYGMGKGDELETLWKSLDPKKHGRFFLAFSGNEAVLEMIRSTVNKVKRPPYEHFVSVWNFTQHKVEYIPFHELSDEMLQKYLRGAIGIPFLSRGEVVNGDRILDGAFVDNIPAYPLLHKDLDYIFCIYFDNYKYFFENDEFNKKVIKLYDFPNEKRLEMMTFKPESFDGMVQYGYDYTMRVIKEVFVSEDREEVYRAIAEQDKNQVAAFKPRLTTEIVLTNINIMTKRYSKRLSKRVREKGTSDSDRKEQDTGDKD